MVVLDNLFPPGGPEQPGLAGHRGGDLHVEQVDIRDAEAIARAFDAHAEAEAVLHLAGQVAVTTSVQNPREDFEINALGTFNVLEAPAACPVCAPSSSPPPTRSTGMEDVGVVERAGRYAYASLPNGVTETQPPDPFSLRV